MIGREDYEERKQERIDRLNGAAEKATERSMSYSKHASELVKDIPFGQPNIEGRPALPRLRAKSARAMDKSLEESEKADYYAGRAEAAESNHAISSDDPQAVEKLKEKLANLEAQRESIKAKNKELKKAGKDIEPAWILTNLGATIRTTKERIEKLERMEQMPAETIKFDGGEIISDIDTNRVKIVFDERQGDEVLEKLHRYGFHWARSEQAWQRLRNQNALCAAKRICNI